MNRSKLAGKTAGILFSTGGAAASVLTVLVITAALIQKGAVSEENVRAASIAASLIGGVTAAILGAGSKGFRRLLGGVVPAVLLLVLGLVVSGKGVTDVLPVLCAACLAIPSAVSPVLAKGRRAGKRRTKRRRH